MNLRNINSVIIATHVFSPGTSQALRDYLLRNKVNVLFIGHSLFSNVFTWALGVLDTIWQVIKTGKKFDLYVGSNNLNAFVGIILRRTRLVKKVIFFTPDYSHQRFKNKLLNNFYHWLDYYCLKNADLVWNSSAVMPVDPIMRERERRGAPIKYRSKQIQVSDGTDLVERLPLDKINRYEVGFVGHLKKGMGLELLIDVFPEITKQVPEAKLVIIGSGPIEQKLKFQAKNLNNIEFTGFVGDLSQVYKRLSRCAIGIAPYEKNTISQYSDPGKVKVYLSVGLPMVITKVPQVAFEIDREKCGIAIDYDRDELIEAVVRLLKDETLLKEYRNNTVRLAEKYSWDRIFERALNSLGK